MPTTGRAAQLLRRLSCGDSKFINLCVNQNPTKDIFCVHRDVNLTKRYTTLGTSCLSRPQLKRSISDNIIKMSSCSGESSQELQKPKHTNSLINEKSTYLLQHAHNPVEWYPWGTEAIEKAKRENKLIFLSIGYATCHWCHVMERESFENEDIAKVMNENFINIKVDREERPDIDRVYMLFVTATTGGGGWPMSVFLTPDTKPVTGGTYFPPEDKYGRPGFKTILLSLAKKWKENQAEFMKAGVYYCNALEKLSLRYKTTKTSVPGENVWNKCLKNYIESYEPDFGGFGQAPKFPQVSIFNFLFHYYARDKNNSQGKMCLDMCLHTLTKIAQGGIHDHIGGGFSRYSVDNDWHVPHFEKMLYDQAQLLGAYTDAYLATKEKKYADVIRNIITYVKRDLRHQDGGFYSAEDADSNPTFTSPEKKEGAFYVWEYSELKSLLKDKKLKELSYLDIFCNYFSIEESGNISPASDPHEELVGKNVLIVYKCKETVAKELNLTLDELNLVLSDCREILYEERQKRPRPHLDTKILCSWNGLMIAGLAQAGQALGDKEIVEDAIKTANFIRQYLYDKSTQTLIHSCYKGMDGSIVQIPQPIQGFLDDYVFLINGLLDLYEASLDTGWLNWARDLQHQQDQLFWDKHGSGYFATTEDDDTVLLRLKSDNDGAEPSGNSVACHNLLRLAAYADKTTSPEDANHHRDMAKSLLTFFSKRLKEVPTALPVMVSALMFYTDSPTQVLIAGKCSDPRTQALVTVVRSRLLPGRVLAVADPATDGTPAGMSDILLSRIKPVDDRPTAYVCRHYSCSLPVTDVEQLENLLDNNPSTKHN